MYQQRIREIYEHLSPGYRRVANFLLNSYREAAFMTAAQIGKSCQVDTALVVRFAQRLGYPGYPELLADVQSNVKQDLRQVYEPGPEARNPAALLQRTLIQDRNNLEYVLLHMETDVIDKVAQLMAQAPRIFLTGEGSAVYLAEAYAARLLAAGFPAHAISQELTGQASLSVGLQASDVVIGFGLTPTAPGVAVMLKIAKSRGARTVGIVGALTNPVAGVAEYVIHAPTDTLGVMPSMTALAAIAHGLVQSLMLVRQETTAEWIMRTDEFFQTYVEGLKRQIPSMRDVVAGYNPVPEEAPADDEA